MRESHDLAEQWYHISILNEFAHVGLFGNRGVRGSSLLKPIFIYFSLAFIRIGLVAARASSIITKIASSGSGMSKASPIASGVKSTIIVLFASTTLLFG